MRYVRLQSPTETGPSQQLRVFRQVSIMRRCTQALRVAAVFAVSGIFALLLWWPTVDSRRPAGSGLRGRVVTYDPLVMVPEERYAVSHTFRIRNPNRQAAKVAIVARSCGCADPRLASSDLGPNEETTLTMRVPLVGRRYDAAEWVKLRMTWADGTSKLVRFMVRVPVVPRISLRLPTHPDLRIPVPEGTDKLEGIPVELLVYYREGESLGEGAPFLEGSGVSAVFYRPPAIDRERWLKGIYLLVWRGQLTLDVGASGPDVRSIRYGFGSWSHTTTVQIVTHHDLIFTPRTLVFGRSAGRSAERTVWLVSRDGPFVLKKLSVPSWLEVEYDNSEQQDAARRLRLRIRLNERPPAGQYELRATVRQEGKERSADVPLRLVVL